MPEENPRTQNDKTDIIKRNPHVKCHIDERFKPPVDGLITRFSKRILYTVAPCLKPKEKTKEK